jgi:ribosomal protection tetracycline resistance protein
VPTGTIATIVPALAERGAAIEVCSTRGSLSTIEVLVAAARAHELQRDLPALTGGEGVLESEFAGYRPVVGPPPRRRATGS